MRSNLLLTVLRSRPAALATLALSAMAVSAHATPINVGDFSATSSSSYQLNNGIYTHGANLNNWTNAYGAYNFVFVPGDTSATSQYGSLSLYHNPTSPKAGNYVGLDSDYGQGAISETLKGLVAGDLVTLNFDFAGAQQTGFSGASTDYLAVSLGGQTIDTQTLHNPSNGFTGWNSESLTFTATGSSEVLSFLAVGTPSGVPSFALLDNVSGTQTPPNSPVPEPASLALLATGLAGLGGLVRSRFSKA